MSSDVPEEYRPRLCHVVKWDDFPGYGFNLHAEKGKAGQFIGKVDANSPAETALLKEGDRIVEVNGVNIGNENHQQVVNRIRTGGEETRLFVVDSGTDSWFKDQKMVLKSDLPCVLFGTAVRNGDTKEDEPEPFVESAPEPEPEPIPEPEPEVEVAAVPVANGNDDVNADDTHTPRLCHMKLWPHFQGYGFNLHAERDKPGQYIGLVDDDSPASTAGLRVQDRIVEVNGTNVEKESHSEVIGRIKAVPGETRMLVVDPEADAYYRDRGVTVSSSMSQTLYIATPDADSVLASEDAKEEEIEDATYETISSVAEAKEEEEEEEKKEEEVEKEEEQEEEKAKEEEDKTELEEEDNKSDVEEEEKKEEEEEKKEEEEEKEEEVVAPVLEEPEVTVAVCEPPAEPEPEVTHAEVTNGNGADEHVIVPPPVETTPPEPEYTVAEKKTPAPEPVAAPAPTPAPAPAEEGLELHLSVSEMKERLKAKKRQDPRLSKVPFEQKFRQFQKL